MFTSVNLKRAAYLFLKMYTSVNLKRATYLFLKIFTKANLERATYLFFKISTGVKLKRPTYFFLRMFTRVHFKWATYLFLQMFTRVKIKTTKYPFLKLPLSPCVDQIGDAHIDQSHWGRAEDMHMPRPCHKASPGNGSSDVAGEWAAALAAASIVFKDKGGECCTGSLFVSFVCLIDVWSPVVQQLIEFTLKKIQTFIDTCLGRILRSETSSSRTRWKRAKKQLAVDEILQRRRK